MKKQTIQLLKQGLDDLDIDLTEEEIEKNLEVPPSIDMGDYAFPCYPLAKKLKKSPKEIALDLRARIGNIPKDFDDIRTSGPYINFVINKKVIAKNTIKDIFWEKKNYGKGNTGEGKKIVIDMSSPNIAKPFGVGHLRSTIIGESVSRICNFQGFETTKINYLGDWGTQFGKLILGYKKFGNEEKLKERPIEYLQELYVKANSDETFEQEARDWFKKLEDGDEEAVKLWKRFRELSLREFNKIYERLGVSFDVISGESEYNNKMQEIIKKLEENNLLEKSEGAWIVNLEDEGLGKALIKKSDGTSLYTTRDLAAAINRKEKYDFDKLIYEVGSEQQLHFKQLFKIIEKLGYSWGKECYHVSHGLYLGEDGKKFSTRKGKTIYMKDILDEAYEKAKQSLNNRENLPEEEIEKRAEKISKAAIFYGDLKNFRENNIVFNIDRFLEFEGNTGPYLLYSYARASSIIEKSKIKQSTYPDSLEEAEIKLVKKLEAFPEITKKAYENFSPNIIANYSYELSQVFNEFYHSCPVIGSNSEKLRIDLVESFRQVLKNSLNLLGIEPLEKM